jgi:ABC-type transporter Mla subunit MlaD
MAELTNLESKVGEVLGLAMAAQGATKKVAGMLSEDEQELRRTLERMHDEASATEERCTELAGTLDGKKTAILEKAREVKGEATEMMETYLAGEEDALDGFEFLTMAEAGEVGHWSIVGKLNERAHVAGLQELVDWALPIQERHLQAVLDGSLHLAAEEDPNEPAE